jgi:hypothetical protein
LGKSQRNKGAVGEREWCAVVNINTGSGAKRDLEQTRDKGGDVPAPPFLFEVKRRKGIAVRSFLDQAEEALATGRYDGCRFPAVAMREDGRTDWMVLMSSETFFDMMVGVKWDLPKLEDIL